MRCDDVTRELASPTGAVSPADLAAHLASCPGCAEWSRRSARLDRAWEATRPAEPSPERLDALWLAASAAIEAGALASPILRLEGRPAPRTRRRWAIGAAVIGLAQAAAILVAALLPERPDANKPAPELIARNLPASPKAVARSAPSSITVDVDQLAVVRIDAGDLDLIDNAPTGNQITVGNSFLAFSGVESLATP